jgi:hypothetical protein
MSVDRISATTLRLQLLSPTQRRIAVSIGKISIELTRMSIAPCATVRFRAVIFPRLGRCRSPYENPRGDYIEDGRFLTLNLGKRTVKTDSVSLDVATIFPP